MIEGTGQFILYTEPGGAQVQLHAVDGTVWLTQSQLAELYGTSVVNIAQIIRRILDDGEVTEATINSELIVRREGNRDVRRELTVYDLEMILAIGYRVTTNRGVQFRQWATTVLREYLVKGFAMQDERLKDPAGVDYFDELLERIRDIRSSEKRFYQKIRDIFAASSVDYAPGNAAAKEFFATIQNKLLFAVTGLTAAELVVARSDPDAENMGLTSWKGERVRKGDVTTSKNYLTADELSALNLLTTRFLDFAEDRARRRMTTSMGDWVARTDGFLQFDERNILTGPGTVSADAAARVTAQRYAEFDDHRRAHDAASADLADADVMNALDRAGRTPVAGESPEHR
ncbi:virulence RhuM family protein [Clavibacter sp. VKM Ac-2873]|uniref:virulence RhuM family protein n=1 Tax=Clavibacter sp. VKM Ac-2873 TaxID=2783813 RepID=UPI00188A9849|nr:virulence RhuM family protein [Clavibacter sp. VKM Ac-2873]MBF4618230.1 virulence RhuM family protein [Clavibacter sp. VKM Ac-2873]